MNGSGQPAGTADHASRDINPSRDAMHCRISSSNFGEKLEGTEQKGDRCDQDMRQGLDRVRRDHVTDAGIDIDPHSIDDAEEAERIESDETCKQSHRRGGETHPRRFRSACV